MRLQLGKETFTPAAFDAAVCGRQLRFRRDRKFPIFQKFRSTAESNQNAFFWDEVIPWSTRYEQILRNWTFISTKTRHLLPSKCSWWMWQRALRFRQRNWVQSWSRPRRQRWRPTSSRWWCDGLSNWKIRLLFSRKCPSYSFFFKHQTNVLGNFDQKCLKALIDWYRSIVIWQAST